MMAKGRTWPETKVDNATMARETEEADKRIFAEVVFDSSELVGVNTVRKNHKEYRNVVSP